MFWIVSRKQVAAFKKVPYLENCAEASQLSFLKTSTPPESFDYHATSVPHVDRIRPRRL